MGSFKSVSETVSPRLFVSFNVGSYWLQTSLPRLNRSQFISKNKAPKRLNKGHCNTIRWESKHIY